MVRQKLKSSGTVSAKKRIPRIRRYFLAGFLVTAPLGITVLIAWWIINFIDEWVTPLIPTKYNPET